MGRDSRTAQNQRQELRAHGRGGGKGQTPCRARPCRVQGSDGSLLHRRGAGRDILCRTQIGGIALWESARSLPATP